MNILKTNLYRIILIFLITSLLTIFKFFYDKNYGLKKFKQSIFFLSPESQYIIAHTKINLDRILSDDQYNKNFYFKASYQVDFDLNFNNLLNIEYTIPRNIDHIKLSNIVFDSILNDLNSKKEFTEREIKKNKRTFTAFHDYDRLRSRYVELFHFENVGVTLINNETPIFRVYSSIFLILIILIYSYVYIRNQKI